MKKKKIFIAVLINIVLLATLSSCIAPLRIQYEETANIATVKYKHDDRMQFGQYTAYYEGEIYYITAREDGYKLNTMTEDGAVNTICTLPKISMLSVTDESICYVGLEGTVDIENYGKVRQYFFYRYDLKDNKTEKIEHEDSYYRTVVAGIAYKDDLWLVDQNTRPAHGEKYSWCFQLAENDQIKENAILLNSDYISGFMMLDKYYITYNSSFDTNKLHEITGDVYSIYDMEAQVLLGNFTKFFASLLYSNSEVMIVSDFHDINVEYNNSRVKFSMTIPYLERDDYFEFAFESNGQYYVILKQENNYRTFWIDMKKQNLEEVLLCAKSCIPLKISNGEILYIDGKQIICSTINENSVGDEKFRIVLPKKVTAKNNIFELCADWLFIYDKNDFSRLLYKVDIKNKICIDASDENG